MDSDVSDVTRDAFLGGRLHILQPRAGHRAGTDAALLASAVPADLAGHVVDVGAGVGAVGLAVATLCPQARVTLLDLDPDAVRLARENVGANDLQARVEVAEIDIFDRRAGRAALTAPADLVVTNPPFYEAGRVREAADGGRRAAHVLPEGKRLADWIAASLALLAPKGTLVLIAPAAGLAEVCASLEARAGGLVVKSVHPQRTAPAHRVLVRARMGSRAPLTIAPPLALHEGNVFTDEAAALHRGEARLAW